MTDYIGQQWGNYRLLRLLGTGGFADVYLGEHVHLGTQAAIKILTTKLSEQEITQFRNEARIISHLEEHPNIVRVLDFDIKNRIPFIVLSYAPSGPVRTQYPRGTRLPLQTVVQYIKQIATALQYAHDQKIIHRDVKPENMLLGRNDELLLSDFGLAAVTHSTRSLDTQNASGTIYYMAPEQLQGKPRPASDQYALGIVAYEWLSGALPFTGTTMEVGMQHLFTPPPPLHESMPAISPEVEQVVLKALAKDPAQRFDTVLLFAEALEQASKKPTIGTKLLTYEHTGDPVNAVAWSPDGKRVASGGNDATVRVWDATTGKTLLILRGHSDVVNAVAWSPDGGLLASGSDDKTVQVWDAQSGVLRNRYEGHSSFVFAVAWSPDGSLLASASRDKTVQVWEARSGRLLRRYEGHSSFVFAVAWSPDGSLLASASKDEIVQVWEVRSDKMLHRYEGHSSWIEAVAWSPNGSLLASGSWDNTVQVWEARSGRLLHRYEGHSDVVNAVAWSPNGVLLASASSDKTVQVWEATSGNVVFTYRDHHTSINSVAWSSDGEHIASASHEVYVWQAP